MGREGDAPFDAVVGGDAEADDGGDYVVSCQFSVVRCLLGVFEEGFDGGFLADEGTAEDADNVVFGEGYFADGIDIHAGHEDADGLHKGHHRGVGHHGVWTAGGGFLAVAPGEVAYALEEGVNIGFAATEEGYIRYERFLFIDQLLPYLAGYFLAGIVDVGGGEFVFEDFETAFHGVHAYALAKVHDVPLEGVVNE